MSHIRYSFCHLAAAPDCVRSTVFSLLKTIKLNNPHKELATTHTGLGGGIGRSFSFVFCHLSPSEISITGISSTMGYLRPQSSHTNQESLTIFRRPSFSRTQIGHRNISSKSGLTIGSPNMLSNVAILPLIVCLHGYILSNFPSPKTISYFNKTVLMTKINDI